MDERRRFERLNFSASIRWDVAGESNDAFSNNTGTTRDISAGGIRVILNATVKAGDILDIELGLPGQDPIRAKGRVVWVEKFQIMGVEDETRFEGGIEFLDISEASRSRINSFILGVKKEPKKDS